MSFAFFSSDKEFAAINQRLVEKGVIDRLQNMLREQLIKSGWRDSLEVECRRVVQKQGLDNVTLDEIIRQVTPVARSTIPNDVKQDLLQRIRDIVQQEWSSK